MFRSDSTEVAKLSSDKNSAPKPTDFTRIFEGDADNVAWVCDMHVYENSDVALVFSVQKNCAKLRHIRDHFAPKCATFMPAGTAKSGFARKWRSTPETPCMKPNATTPDFAA